MSQQLCILAKVFEVCDEEEVVLCDILDTVDINETEVQESIDACIPPICELEAHFAAAEMMDGEMMMMGEDGMMTMLAQQDGDMMMMGMDGMEMGQELPEGCDPDAFMTEFMESDAPKTAPTGIPIPDDRMVETD